MADLLDIAPSTSCEVVKLDGKRIIVRGLQGPAIASIVARFPDLGFVLGGAIVGINPSRIIAQFGNAIGPIIAAGCGHLGDEKYEERAAALSIEHQFELVTAIIKLTFPKGMGSFIERLAVFMQGAEEGKVIKIRLRKSPSQSPPLFDAASRPNMQ